MELPDSSVPEVFLVCGFGNKESGIFRALWYMPMICTNNVKLFWSLTTEIRFNIYGNEDCVFPRCLALINIQNRKNIFD